MSTQAWKLLAVGASSLLALFVLVYLPSIYTFLGSFLTVAAAVWYAEYEGTGRIPFWNQAVLITGCDTGFGHELVHHLSSLGVMVFAGCLDAAGKGAERLRDSLGDSVHVLQLDVTSDEQVAAAVEYVNKHKPRRGLWGLVNNAGIDFNGDLELNTMEQFEKIIQVNFLGVVRVTKAFLPLVKRTEGRIVNVTSVHGRLYMAYCSAYESSKHALEVFSDVLRLEMRPWRVAVSIIEPGHYGGATNCIDMTRRGADFETMWKQLSPEAQHDYGRSYIDAHLARLKNSAASSARDITPVLKAMTAALFDITPRARYLVPGSNKLFDVYKWTVLISPYLPTFVLDRLMLFLFPGPVPDTFQKEQ